jgi:FkbM family methyltransferase
VSSSSHPPGSPPGGWDKRATPEDVYYAYRLLLRRPPDRDGFDHYQRLIDRGITLEYLAESFVTSDEANENLKPTPVDLDGYQVCVRRRDREFASNIVATQDYEPHVRQAVRERVSAGDVVVDIGANVGCIALLAAKLVGQDGLVVAVEPNPDNLQMLYAGIVLNRTNNVRVLSCAASIGSEIVSLSDNSSNSHLLKAQPPRPLGVYAQTTALDESLAWLQRLDLVKIDVEGHEIEAFDGFRTLIERHRPALVVEFNPRCLRDFGAHDPAILADRILRLYPSVQAISAFGDNERFARSEALMDYWRRRDHEVTGAGLLPGGMLHFDLIAERGRPRRHR